MSGNGLAALALWNNPKALQCLVGSPVSLPYPAWLGFAGSRIDADDHGKNIGHGLEMSGTIGSSAGTLSSSFVSKH
jgi:hypothetical protein